MREEKFLFDKVEKFCIYFLSITPFFYIIFIAFLFDFIQERYFLDIFKEIKDINYSPILMLFLIFTIAVSVKFLDKIIYNNNTKIDYQLRKILAKIGFTFAKGDVVGTFLISWIVFFRIIDNSEFAEIFYTALFSSVFAGIVNWVLKPIISRERPLKEGNQFHFFVFKKAYKEGKLFRSKYTSTPSGHTITAFSVILPFIMHFDNLFLDIILVIYGIFIGMSRVFHKRHWFTDVFISIILGTIIGISSYNLIVLGG